MKHALHRWITALFFVNVGLGTICYSQQSLPSRYELLLDALNNISADPENVASVSDLELHRDCGVFALHEGVIVLCTPVEGRVCAAVFMGKGVFSLTPPTDVERLHLERTYGSQSAHEEFTLLFMMFGDSTFDELRHRLSFGTGSVPRTTNKEIKGCLSFLGYPDYGYFNTECMTTFLNERVNSLFYAHFVKGSAIPKFFEINPFEEEEVHFMERNLRVPWGSSDILTQFHTLEEYIAGVNDDERKDQIQISAYEVESQIEDNLHFSAKAKLSVVSSVENQQWTSLLLYEGLEVDSVISDQGALSYYRGDNNPYVWIQFPRPQNKGERRALTLFYHGALFERGFTSEINLLSPSNWYPRHRFHENATFALTYRYPSRYKLESTGDRLSVTTEGETTTERYAMQLPTGGSMSFALGYFNTIEATSKETPPLALLMYDKKWRPLKGETWDPAILITDLQTMLRFYGSLFGEYPFTHLTATEIGGFHGEAFPGLVHLSWVSSVKNSGARYFFDMVRAHEVAHQWWGVSVETKTYHDRWLDEGLAQYCALLYIESLLNDNKHLFATLENWTREILENRNFLFSKGQQAAPVWLGSRSESAETEGDYTLLVYKKSGAIFHMLRIMMLNLSTMNEDRFFTMLKTFYRSGKGHRASTADFQRIVEKYMGDDMSWFFNQWVMGTEIPEYLVAHKSNRNEDGTYTVNCRVRQTGVPPTFQAYIIILVKFSDGTDYRTRMLVSGESLEFDLGSLPKEPSEVVFNDLNGVLCKVQLEHW